jgi:hemerythrin superfamily protein
MSVIDKVVAAITPPESDEDRLKARERAREHAQSSPWLATVLEHHQRIERAFADIKAANDPSSRRIAQKELGSVLTGHSNAEESVIYPALSQSGETGHATMAYSEQAAAKMQMALLENLDPMSQDYLDKLQHIESAVQHHVYQEEGTWFPEMIDEASDADHQMINQRYNEEFNRYMGGETVSAEPKPEARSAFSSAPARDDSDDYLRAEPRGEGFGGRPGTGSSTDDTSGGDDLMSPGRPTTGLPEFR